MHPNSIPLGFKQVNKTAIIAAHHSGPYRISGLFVSWFQLTVCHVKLQNVASCRLASNTVFDIEKQLGAIVHRDEAVALRSEALASSREGACALDGTAEG